VAKAPQNPKVTAQDRPKRQAISQSIIPRITLDDAVALAQGLVDHFAGRSASPYQLALALGISPTSTNWQKLTGAAIAYGLTEGGYNSSVISLTTLGRRIVSPTDEGDDLAAKREASLRPTVLRNFFQRYHRNKFPSDTIAINVLAELGVPQDRLAESLAILKANGQSLGIVLQTKTGPFVALDTPIAGHKQEDPAPVGAEAAGAHEDLQPGQQRKEPDRKVPVRTGIQELEKQTPNRRVFITHGKDRSIVQQIKEILIFGKFEPVVSVERESTAVPVPDKVFSEMRDCAAGIIHVMSEGELMDGAGAKVTKINDNVLIEIGAALALYRNRVILLTEKGLRLPSNLQGLYYCSYEGNRLDYEATMKLLKTFNEFQIG
jgi:predicted nucleotide-binding protein